MLLIGISGKKQSGKSTLAEGIVGRDGSNRAILTFASPLKRLVHQLFDNRKVARYETEEEKSYKLPCGHTVREVLQLFGTDACRGIDINCWLRMYKKTIGEHDNFAVVVTPDVRFPNEVETIKKLGGVCIRLTRNPIKKKDTHESETALDDYTGWDLVIDNSKLSAHDTLETALEWLSKHKKLK